MCLSKRPKDLNKAKKKLTTLLQKETLKLTTIKERMNNFNETTWMRALNELVDDGVINETTNGYYLAETTNETTP